MKKLEFMQKVVVGGIIFAVLIVLLTLGANFVLLWRGKESMAQETIAVITTFGGILASDVSAAYAMDTAKEFAMMERNDKGKTVRRYFIEAEKRYREIKLIRARSKAERRLFTDIIRDLLPESPNKKWAYKQFTDLVYKHVTGYNAKQLREMYDKPIDYNVRDMLSPQQLKEVIKYESIIEGLLQLGQDYAGVKAILDDPAAFLPQKAG